MRIAILEDDPDQAEILRLWLEDAEHSVADFATGSEFLKAVRRDSYDMYLLDWMLPDISGIDVLKTLRGKSQDVTPVLITTVKNEERDIVRALESGADDFLAKPVRRRELVARLDAICRRSMPGRQESASLDAPPYSLDLRRQRVMMGNEEITLTNREFELVLFFFRNAGRVVSRAHILETIWGIDNAGVSTRTVDTHISRLRKKMKLKEKNGWKLSSIYQHGYRLEQVGPESLDST